MSYILKLLPGGCFETRLSEKKKVGSGIPLFFLALQHIKCGSYYSLHVDTHHKKTKVAQTLGERKGHFEYDSPGHYGTLQHS